MSSPRPDNGVLRSLFHYRLPLNSNRQVRTTCVLLLGCLKGIDQIRRFERQNSYRRPSPEHDVTADIPWSRATKVRPFVGATATCRRQFPFGFDQSSQIRIFPRKRAKKSSVSPVSLSITSVAIASEQSNVARMLSESRKMTTTRRELK